MSDLIYRDQAIEAISKLPVKVDNLGYTWTIANDVLKQIDDIPSAEQERTAKVFMDLRCVNGIAYHQYICSVCDKSLNIPEVGKSPDWKPKYCVNCGARLEWK